MRSHFRIPRFLIAAVAVACASILGFTNAAKADFLGEMLNNVARDVKEAVGREVKETTRDVTGSASEKRRKASDCVLGRRDCGDESAADEAAARSVPRAASAAQAPPKADHRRPDEPRIRPFGGLRWHHSPVDALRWFSDDGRFQSVEISLGAAKARHGDGFGDPGDTIEMLLGANKRWITMPGESQRWAQPPIRIRARGLELVGVEFQVTATFPAAPAVGEMHPERSVGDSKGRFAGPLQEVRLNSLGDGEGCTAIVDALRAKYEEREGVVTSGSSNHQLVVRPDSSTRTFPRVDARVTRNGCTILYQNNDAVQKLVQAWNQRAFQQRQRAQEDRKLQLRRQARSEGVAGDL